MFERRKILFPGDFNCSFTVLFLQTFVFAFGKEWWPPFTVFRQIPENNNGKVPRFWVQGKGPQNILKIVKYLDLLNFLSIIYFAYNSFVKLSQDGVFIFKHELHLFETQNSYPTCFTIPAQPKLRIVICKYW